MKHEPDFFPIQSLTFDPDLQIRVRINEETISLYAEQMATEAEMKKFPAVEIYYDGTKYWLADGHHRRAAAEKAGHDKVWAVVKSGTRTDALWGAVLGNVKQGFGLTRADKQRAIMLVIQQCSDKSNRMIADAVGCNEKTVRIYRESTAENSAVDNQRRTGKDGKSRPAKFKRTDEKQGSETDSAPPTFTEATDMVEDGNPVEQPPDTTGDDTYPAPPCPNKDVKYFPKTTLNLIPQESPRVLLVNLFEIFREGFVEEMVVMAMDMLVEEKGKNLVKTLAVQLYKKHGKK